MRKLLWPGTSKRCPPRYSVTLPLSAISTLQRPSSSSMTSGAAVSKRSDPGRITPTDLRLPSGKWTVWLTQRPSKKTLAFLVTDTPSKRSAEAIGISCVGRGRPSLLDLGGDEQEALVLRAARSATRERAPLLRMLVAQDAAARDGASRHEHDARLRRRMVDRAVAADARVEGPQRQLDASVAQDAGARLEAGVGGDVARGLGPHRARGSRLDLARRDRHGRAGGQPAGLAVE